MRELTVTIWRSLPEELRLELLCAVQSCSPHRADIPESLYALASEMLEESWKAVMFEEFALLQSGADGVVIH